MWKECLNTDDSTQKPNMLIIIVTVKNSRFLKHLNIATIENKVICFEVITKQEIVLSNRPDNIF